MLGLRIIRGCEKIPATRFICPDGYATPIKYCLEHGCRMAKKLPAGRCLSPRTLRFIAEQREWTGIPSTTQLLKGTREAMLEILTDYDISPQDALFRIFGTKSHNLLDKYTDGNELAEERLYDEISSGQFDFYDPIMQQLIDCKFWGSYKIMKALGLYQVEVPTGEVYKTGKKKGQPKTRKEWREGGRKDRLDVAVQLNDYRMKLESIGFPVRQMVIEAVARDGNTYIAKNRGIEQNGFLIPVNRISDPWVRRYMKAKRDALMKALETHIVPPKCKPREMWNGRKCERYCNVRVICSKLKTGEKLGGV